MRTYWLLDRHGSDGPTALVETDGSMHIIDVRRFGPDVTELDEQQAIWDQVIGQVAPTLKPLVDGSSLDEPGVEPHPDLRRTDAGHGRPNPTRPGSRGRGAPRSRAVGGPSRKRSRGDR